VPAAPAHSRKTPVTRNHLSAAKRNPPRHGSRVVAALLLVGFLALLPVPAPDIHADGGGGNVSASFRVSEEPPAVSALHYYLPYVSKALPSTQTPPYLPFASKAQVSSPILPAASVESNDPAFAQSGQLGHSQFALRDPSPLLTTAVDLAVKLESMHCSWAVAGLALVGVLLRRNLRR
jgi:hypothetical protein